ncbi:MAG: Uma2 family endonuclease [Anaerolineae bacterium]|nr:Uma2 family endonuclease [Anaerolineae bacterium]
MLEKVRITAADYFQLPDSMRLVELLDGEIIRHSLNTPVHQRCVGQSMFLIGDLIPNGEVFIAPIGVQFDDLNAPEPDVVWVAEGSPCIVEEKSLIGPPDLIVEVLSPGTTRQDRKQKFALYERHGVREYWIVDPIDRYIEVYQNHDKQFTQQGIFEPGETFDSAVLGGKTVEVSKLFAGS